MSEANLQLNPAKSTSFIFQITNRKDLSFRIQTASIGSVNLGVTPFATQTRDLLIPSNKLDYGPMSMRFLVSENLTEWFGVYKWMIEITKTNDAHTSSVETGELTILDSQNREIMRVIYSDVFPLTLGELTYSLIDEEETLVADLVLMFDKFDIENLITGERLSYE